MPRSKTELSKAIDSLTTVIHQYYPMRILKIWTPKFLITIERHETELAGFSAGMIIADHPLLKKE